MKRWRGRTALVTGASNGIGLGVAESLARTGMNVVACARTLAPIEALAKAMGGSGQGKVYPIQCDLTKELEILEMFKTIEQKFKHVDLLVNNAGLSHPDDLLTGRTDKWREMIDLNVLALSICTREALRLMEKDGINDGHVIMSTGFGMIHFYSGTKHMVTALTKALNAELRQKKSKIRMTDISPGGVTTGFQDVMTADNPALKEAFKQHVTYPFLNVQDISDAVLYVVGAPAHVTIQELVITPTEQEAF